MYHRSRKESCVVVSADLAVHPSIAGNRGDCIVAKVRSRRGGWQAEFDLWQGDLAYEHDTYGQKQHDEMQGEAVENGSISGNCAQLMHVWPETGSKGSACGQAAPELAGKGSPVFEVIFPKVPELILDPADHSFSSLATPFPGRCRAPLLRGEIGVRLDHALTPQSMR